MRESDAPHPTTAQDAQRSIALPPPSRRLRCRLRYAATAAPLRLRKRPAGCLWPSMAASVAALRKLEHARRPASRLRAHRRAECACSAWASTRIAARTTRLPLRLQSHPPSPLAHRVLALHRDPRVRSRGSGGLFYIMHLMRHARAGRDQRHRMIERHARPSTVTVRSRCSSIARSNTTRAHRIRVIMSTSPSASLRSLRCAARSGACAGCPCVLRGRPWPRRSSHAAPSLLSRSLLIGRILRRASRASMHARSTLRG